MENVELREADIVSGKVNSDIVTWLAELKKKRIEKRASGRNEKGGVWEDRTRWKNECRLSPKNIV